MSVFSGLAFRSAKHWSNFILERMPQFVLAKVELLHLGHRHLLGLTRPSSSLKVYIKPSLTVLTTLGPVKWS